MDSNQEKAPIQIVNDLSSREFDLFLLAKSYFDMKEHLRVARLLESATHPKLIFLRLYSKFLAIERENTDEKQIGSNKLLSKQLRELLAATQEAERLDAADGFVIYLYYIL